MDFLLRLFIGLLIIICIILINLLLQEFNKQKKHSKQSFSSKVNRSEVEQLKNQLLRMVGGNQKTVKRLIRHLRLKHPKERETWYFEKAIYDLERDRNFK